LEATIDALMVAANTGDRVARQQLFESLYKELHRLAEREVSRQSGRVTIGATTLLHEAYLDFAGRDNVTFPDRFRFMAYAAQAMHGVITTRWRGEIRIAAASPGVKSATKWSPCGLGKGVSHVLRP
jgi:DNA-directed RNA polymerase specialized sigma24 family protein